MHTPQVIKRVKTVFLRPVGAISLSHLPVWGNQNYQIINLIFIQDNNNTYQKNLTVKSFSHLGTMLSEYQSVFKHNNFNHFLTFVKVREQKYQDSQQLHRNHQ